MSRKADQMMTGQETLHKLMVLYMLKRVNFPMSTAQLWQYFRGKEYMTEEEFLTLMNGLRDANLVRSEELNSVLRHELTKEGDEALFYFTSDISESLRKDMEDYIRVNRFQARNETGIATGYEPSGDGGYYVQLKIREEKTVLFEMRLSVPDKEQAETLANHLQDNAQAIYAFVMKKLV